MNGYIKVVIYACEESSRFGNACIGSKYLNGSITETDFDNILDQKELSAGNRVTLRDAIKYANDYLKANVQGITEVEKVFDNVDYSLEAHIEQYEILDKKQRKQKESIIGIINSIGSAVRVKYEALGESGHTGSTPMIKRKNAVDAASIIGRKVRRLGREYEKLGLGRASQVEINTIGHGGSFNQIPNKAQGLIDFRLLGKNTPNEVLADFKKIVKRVERITGTQISAEVVSKGTPVVTSELLNERIADVCNQDGIQHFEMPSYAGQDTGYIPATDKTMIFIPSTGGSHNPKESAKKEDVELAGKVFVDVSKELLQERFRDRQKVDVSQLSVNNSTYSHHTETLDYDYTI